MVSRPQQGSEQCMVQLLTKMGEQLCITSAEITGATMDIPFCKQSPLHGEYFLIRPTDGSNSVEEVVEQSARIQ